MALGYIRREVGVPGREVMIGTARATVVQLPVEDTVLLTGEFSRGSIGREKTLTAELAEESRRTQRKAFFEERVYG